MCKDVQIVPNVKCVMQIKVFRGTKVIATKWVHNWFRPPPPSPPGLVLT